MLFNYDSWNRMQTITYPDGEVVSYSYDCGGNIAAVWGDKGAEHFDYINRLFYNCYGQRSYVMYGNGTHTNYTYDNLQRLSQLTSYDRQGNAMQDIKYTFDAVSNITQVKNNAPAIGTLGGQYSNEYIYDNLYRLTSATQSYGNGNVLAMGYSPNGRVLAKTQTHTGQDNVYKYCRDRQPHAIRRIDNALNDEIADLQWDDNGNLGQVNWFGHLADGSFGYDRSRFLYWTEDNRLAAAVDPTYFSYYGYDHAGERTLKLTGKSSLIDVNADFMTVASTLDNVTLYTSPYMVCTEKGYTKHIYAGTERLCAKRGGGGFGTMAQLLGTDAALQGNTKDLFLQVIDDMRDRNLPSIGCAEPLPVDAESAPGTVKAEVDADPTQLTVALENHRTSIHQETDRYFYHSDHLGSASWITDASGTPIQHLQYCPYGEPFVDQHPANIYQERFTFTGKERDAETGYHYFGARYLDADWMTGWLSVDPKSDKYPTLSPYNYCAWNPVKLVDLDGNDFDPESQQYVDALVKEAVSMIARNIKNKNWEGVIECFSALSEINVLQASSQRYSVEVGYSPEDPHEGGNAGFDIDNDRVLIQLKKFNLGALAHELKHAYQFEKGEMSYSATTGTGGLLYDICDEYEAYSRGAVFGAPRLTEEQIQTLYPNLTEKAHDWGWPGNLSLSSYWKNSEDITIGAVLGSALHRKTTGLDGYPQIFRANNKTLRR